MWYWTLLQILIKALPIERVVAKLFNWLLDRYLDDPHDLEGYTAAIRTAQRVQEQVAVVLSALEDREVTDDEVTQAGVGVIRQWAAGEIADKINEHKALRK